MQIVLIVAILLLVAALVREHRLRRKAESRLQDMYRESVLYDDKEEEELDPYEYRPEWQPDLPLSEQPIRDYVARRNPEGSIFAIRYRSLSDVVTERIVMPAIIDAENGEGTFQAYCYMRDDLRKFNLKRVIDYFDPETGEVFLTFEDALSKGEMIAKRWKLERKQRRKAGERLGVVRH